MLALNRRRILGEICEKANLFIHSEGVRFDQDGFYVGWIKLQVPHEGSASGRVFKTVTGHSCSTEHEAREKAAQEAIVQIMESGSIVINDVNYSSLYTALGQLRSATAQSYFNGVQATQLAWERDNLSREKDVILTHLAHICTSFNDILPVEVIRPLGPGIGLCAGMFAYTGAVPPVTRIEQVAYFIVHTLLGSRSAGGRSPSG